MKQQSKQTFFPNLTFGNCVANFIQKNNALKYDTLFNVEPHGC